MITRSASKFGLVAATLIALAPAESRAQVPEEEGTEPTEEAEPAEASDASSPDPAPAAEAVVDAGEPARWPRSVIARPLTLPKSLIMVGADPAANKDFSAVATTLVAGVGISDKLEAVLYYGYALKEFEIKGDLDVNVGYAAIRGAAGGKLEVVPRATVGYSVVGEGMRPLALGAQAQYNLTDKIAVITPGGQLGISLEEDATMAKPITFGLPVAAGFQPTPELYLQLDTTLASFSISDSANAFIFADTTPVKLSAIYNVIPALDVGAAIGLDVTADSAADTLAFLLGVRYYGGAL